MSPLVLATIIGLAFAALVVGIGTLLVRIRAGVDQIAERVSDYRVITPQSPGVQGTVSARMFEAMKDVCECARALRVADELQDHLKGNPATVQADVTRAWNDYMEKTRTHKAAVDRYIKIMLEQPVKETKA